MDKGTGYRRPPIETRFGGKRANPRNNKGRPKTFDALRKLAQSIAHREVNANGMTVTEAILTGWAASKDPKLQIQFIYYAYGKVPDQVQADVSTVSMTLDEWRKQKEKNLAAVARMEEDFGSTGSPTDEETT